MTINARDDVGDSGYGVPYNVETEKIELLAIYISNFLISVLPFMTLTYLISL